MAYTLAQLTEFFTNANAGTAPTEAQKLALQGLLNDNQSGLSNDATFSKVVDLASDSTVAVSVGTYNFFLGYAPSQAGLTALNAAYVGAGKQSGMNAENRFIAQSISLSMDNATAKANFSASYGSLSLADAAKAAYLIIIGQAAATANNINVDNAVAFLTNATSVAYYTALVKANYPNASAADQALAVKAAVVGEILFQATSYNQGAGIGSYAQASTNLVKDLALDNVLTNDSTTGIDLLGKYGTTNGGGSSLVLTSGVDTITGTSGDDTITGLVDTTAGATPTFTALDTIAGGAGNDTLIINSITALAQSNINAVTVTGVENVTLRGAAAVVADVTNWTDVTALNVTQATSATVGASGTANIGVSGVTGAITIDGGKGVTVTDATAGNAITIGGTTAPKGVVSVTDTSLTTGSVNVQGGTNVTVTTSGATTGTVTVGGTTSPSGVVTIANTGAAYDATAANNALGAITVTGGTTVNVTQTAYSSTADAAADTAAVTRTQGAVTVNGGAATTEVSVTQSATVAAVNQQTADGTKSVETVTFVAMAASETITVNGLTFTAAKALTAAEAAAAFANLANGATTGSAPVTNGTYSGTFSTVSGSTGAVTTASGVSTVSFTQTSFGATTGLTVADTAAAGNVSVATATAGAAQTITSTKAGVAGVAAGAVTINGAITGADVLSKVTLNSYGTVGITSDALTTLSLANSDAAVTVTNAAATTLGLTVNKVGSSTTTAALNLGSTYTTLNLAVAGASVTNLTAAGVTALAVTGSAAADLTGSTLTALKTVTVAGSAGVTLAAPAALTSFDASATSGANTVTALDASTATYTGGTGVDTVTLGNTTVSKAVSLGAGDDVLNLASGTTSLTATVNGGDGTDTLGMATADAVTATAGAAFASKVVGFEKLSLGLAAASGTVNLANLNNIGYVITNGVGANTTTLSGFVANGTLELAAVAQATGTVAVTLADATGTSDVLNVVAKVSTADLNHGTVSAAGVETINLTATDTSTTAAINRSTISITDSALKTLTIAGNAKATVTYDSTALTSVNASTNTGGVTVSTLSGAAAATTVTGGTGADTLTANHASDVLIGGDGADSLTAAANLVTLTGGAGADTFNVAFVVSNANSYATITDASAGDSIVLKNVAAVTETFASAKVALGDTAVFQDFANQAISTTTAGAISWFQYAGNTYIVENASGSATAFQNGTDVVVKLAGLVDLSTASFSASSQTLVLH
ncbi:hypothetical protein [Caulobacter sp. X]|uniref:beta strand repeat-containing protein n=1 Tax=Caulobacter sp. X TaxID=2048901 RepID=UPI000C148BA8|nr:hypothetical protein [Caulobacter sp. X]PIC01078.1 hypothetical protein CSW60_05950 [Caulobacter sp. X]